MSAEININNGLYRAAVNRAYYCILHMMRSLLILHGKDYKSHSAVISSFRKEYIKTGIFNTELSDIISQASKQRNNSDYADLINITRDEAEKLIKNVKIFYETVKSYIEKQINGLSE